MTLYCQRGIAARVAMFVFFGATWVGTAASASVAQPGDTQPTALVDAYGKLPILFEANRGQVDSVARFIARGSGYAVFLTQDETLISLSRSNARGSQTQSTEKETVIGMRFAGARKSAPLFGERKTDSTSNYFLGPDSAQHITDIPHYGAVRQTGIYPGIDAVFYGNQRQLEYDLIVTPGADPGAIRLAFSGVGKVSIDRQGNLVLHSAHGNLAQHKPVIYQQRDGEREPIAGRYVKRGREIGFQVAAYDKSLALVIDPVVSYSTFLGGVNGDIGQAIAVDSAGNAYITGATSSPRFPAANAIDRRIGHNEQDAFVTKLNASGTGIVYSTYLGGAKGYDSGVGIAVDSAGNAYVAGTTTGTGFPTTTGAYQTAGTSWVARLNAAGNALLYSTYLTGARVAGIAINGSGNAFVSGWTDPTFTATPGSFQSLPPTKNAARSSAFVAKLNSTGTALVYGTYLSGERVDEARGIAVDQAGNAYVVGVTDSRNFPVLSPIQPYRGRFSAGGLFADDTSAFITKLNASGSGLVYSTYLGGSYHDAANAVAVDAAGNAHVTGAATSLDFPLVNPFQGSKRNNNPELTAAFVAKLNANGSALIYSSYLGGLACPPNNFPACDVDAGDVGLAVAGDGAGNAYYTGGALLTSFPMLYPIQPDKRQGTNHIFVTKLAPTGQRINTLLIGGSGIAGNTRTGDFGNGIALDGAGGIYLTGYTTSLDFPVTAGVYQPTMQYNARKVTIGVDAFVVKLTSPNYTVALTSSVNPVLSGQPVTFTATVTAPGKPPISSGSVTFSDDLFTQGSVLVSNGVATTTTAYASGGIRRLSAVYADQGDGGAGSNVQLVTPTGPCQRNAAATIPAPGYPLVALNYPPACSTITLPATIVVGADAIDTDGSIARVDFFANGTLIGSSSTPYYYVTWNNPVPAPGTYTLTAVATDNSGLSTTSTPVVFTVGQANISPTVSITSPASGASFRAGGSVTVTANAVDTDGSIARVDFMVNNVIVSGTNVAPYTGLWANIAAGTHTLTARATDNQGAQTTSTPVTITVTPNNPPTVSLTAPQAGAQYIAPASIAFAATASDSDGSIARVEFLLNGNVVGTATTAPYTFTTTNVAAGSTTASARAIDNDGATTTSAGVTLNVAANQAPIVSITTPTSGATFNSPVDVTITASATDSDGSVTRVELFAGTTLLATLTAAPYSTVWRNPLPGSYVLTARATDDRGAATTSAGVPITIGGTSVQITAPADGAIFAAPALITLQATAATTGANVTKLEFFDGSTRLSTFNVNAPSVPASLSIAGVAAGIHIYTVKATISTGATVTSAPVTVNVVPGATVDLSTLSNFYLAPATIDLNATVAAVANTTIARVEFFNGTNLIATVTAPPYNFRWLNVAAGSYSFTAKVTDSRGLTNTSPAMSVTVGSNVAIQIGAGLNGATVDEDSVFVSGSVSAPPNSAVSVNGQLATVTGSGQFFLNDLYMQAGPNTVTATVTTPDGQTASQAITVTRSTNAALFSVSVTPSGIVAPGTPFIADIIVENQNNTPFATVTVACNDPAPGLDSTTVGRYQCPFTEPGNYTARVTVKNVLGITIYSVVKKVKVEAAQALYNSLIFIYSGATDRLKAGNIDGALNSFTGTVREKYRVAFTEIGTGLPALAGAFGGISRATFADSFAELIVIRSTVQGEQSYPVMLVLCSDGIWRIDGF